MNRRLIAGLLLALGLALGLRLPHLGARPLHNDEAVNAVKFADLVDRGRYKYDPNEHHGPALFYATLPLLKVLGIANSGAVTENQMRMVTVLFGAGLILLLPLIVDGIGRSATFWAALFTAISPAFVFYSDYFIHEMLLVFFTFLAVAAGWRYWRDRKWGWALLAGAAVGLMQATKETFVITLVAAGLALGVNQAWNRWLDATGLPVKAPRLRWQHLAGALGVWAGVAILLFSSFFTNAAGPADAIRTYAPWVSRAGGNSPHIHPWFFYFQRLLFFHGPRGPVWSEALIGGLAVIGILAAFARRGLGDANASFVRFVALYTFFLAGAYAFIAYKTPWCLLSFWHGAILLAGVGAVALIRAVRYQVARAAMILLLLAAAGQLAAQAIQASGRFSADPGNPYVYAQTSQNFLELVDRVNAVAAAAPQPQNTVIKVMAPEGEYWPLPWYLRRFKQVGWWEEMPSQPYAPIMIVSAKFHANLDERKTHLMTGIYMLRPDTFFELYVELGLWKAFLEKNPPKERD
jgi:uncharacterized protein (TIGR03663 family)